MKCTFVRILWFVRHTIKKKTLCDSSLNKLIQMDPLGNPHSPPQALCRTLVMSLLLWGKLLKSVYISMWQLRRNFPTQNPDIEKVFDAARAWADFENLESTDQTSIS